jgi:hypothetical protein
VFLVAALQTPGPLAVQIFILTLFPYIVRRLGRQVLVKSFGLSSPPMPSTGPDQTDDPPALPGQGPL